MKLCCPVSKAVVCGSANSPTPIKAIITIVFHAVMMVAIKTVDFFTFTTLYIPIRYLIPKDTHTITKYICCGNYANQFQLLFHIPPPNCFTEFLIFVKSWIYSIGCSLKNSQIISLAEISWLNGPTESFHALQIIPSGFVSHASTPYVFCPGQL